MGHGFSLMDLKIGRDGFATWGERRMRCALGRTGISADKREGDGATPVGTFIMRQILYRPDRETEPQTALPTQTIEPDDGWCDAPDDPAYNRPILLPHRASAENLWRADDIYDLIVVLGHNDDPAVPGLGSAIFLHLARPDFSPTAGCIALSRDDLLAVLGTAELGSTVVIS
jgi:L,D-peptidoglycan transpeptidase YkuD (ErfK/YbiS/YcfS/YnhG family)